MVAAAAAPPPPPLCNDDAPASSRAARWSPSSSSPVKCTRPHETGRAKSHVCQGATVDGETVVLASTSAGGMQFCDEATSHGE
ncbi:hypothetical protein G7054_g13702 [Neopestalotiopsis clavispora]|nr:hypothetical protein G7054_g13702 [Neopestalotiopsis clavispora]